MRPHTNVYVFLKVGDLKKCFIFYSSVSVSVFYMWPMEATSLDACWGCVQGALGSTPCLLGQDRATPDGA